MKAPGLHQTIIFKALQAIHGVIHASNIGVKYTWFGSGYISNMYYKWLANHATYDFEHGGDFSFDAHINSNVHMVASGDAEGNPRKQTGGIEEKPGKIRSVSYNIL